MHSPENERIKRAYFIYLKEARRLGEHSIDSAAAALARFEDYTKYRDFKRFHIQQAIGFKSRLSEHISPPQIARRRRHRQIFRRTSGCPPGRSTTETVKLAGSAALPFVLSPPMQKGPELPSQDQDWPPVIDL